jgi:hypothetical protein
MHGGILAGLGVLILWAIIHLIQNFGSWKRIIPPILISIFSCLINPYGLDLIVFLFRTATVPRPEIVDWQPLKLISVLGIAYLVTLALSTLGWLFSRREKRLPLLILFIVISIMPMVAIRHLQMYSMAFLLLAGEHILDTWSKITVKRQSKLFFSRWIISIPIVASIALLAGFIPSNGRIHMPTGDSELPTNAVNLLKQSQVSGNLAVDFGWGEYVIWHMDPWVKVAMDGRRETVYPDEVYNQYKAFHFGVDEWDSILDDYDTHMALVKVDQPSYNLLKMKHGWEMVFEDSVSALFASHNWSNFDAIMNLDYTPKNISNNFP